MEKVKKRMSKKGEGGMVRERKEWGKDREGREGGEVEGKKEEELRERREGGRERERMGKNKETHYSPSMKPSRSSWCW